MEVYLGGRALDSREALHQALSALLAFPAYYGKNLDALKAALNGREAYAARNLGMDSAWTGPLANIPADAYSYFTTVIAKP